jgi:hypothetical protein
VAGAKDPGIYTLFFTDGLMDLIMSAPVISFPELFS